VTVACHPWRGRPAFPGSRRPLSFSAKRATPNGGFGRKRRPGRARPSVAVTTPGCPRPASHKRRIFGQFDRTLGAIETRPSLIGAARAVSICESVVQPLGEGLWRCSEVRPGPARRWRRGIRPRPVRPAFQIDLIEGGERWPISTALAGLRPARFATLPGTRKPSRSTRALIVPTKLRSGEEAS